MPSVDLVDETFVVVSPHTVAAVVGDPQRWRTWWPGLQLSVFMDRADEGIRWTVTGELVGSGVTDAVAAGLDAVHLHCGQRVHDLGALVERDPVVLQVLAQASVVLVDETGDPAERDMTDPIDTSRITEWPQVHLDCTTYD